MGLLLIGILSVVGFVFSFENSSASEQPVSTGRKNMMNNSYDNLFSKWSDWYDLSFDLVKSISYVESKVGTYPSVAKGIANPNDVNGSKSSDGLSWGIMQMTLTTSRDYDSSVTAIKLNDVEYSIKLACRHLSHLSDVFENERDIVMAYNQGEGNQAKFLASEKNGTLKSTSYPQARDYWNKYLEAKTLL